MLRTNPQGTSSPTATAVAIPQAGQPARGGFPPSRADTLTGTPDPAHSAALQGTPRRHPYLVFAVGARAWRQSLRTSLMEAGTELAGEACCPLDALPLMDVLTPSIAVCRIDTWKRDTSWWQGLSAVCIHTAVLLIAPVPDDDRLFACLELGVRGILPLSCSPNDIMTLVSSISEGLYPIADDALARPKVVAHIIAALASMRGTEYLDLLARRVPGGDLFNDRELAILAAVCAGKSNAEIAQERGVSEQTIKNALTSIYRTLKVENRAAAVKAATRLEIFNPLAERPGRLGRGGRPGA